MESALAGMDLRGVALGNGKTLSSRVAAALLARIREGGLVPGARLPTEYALSQSFGVSRTVVREAIVTLKAQGVVETRQGSGAFVREPARAPALTADTPLSVQQLGLMIEVRKGIDCEIAALAAERRTPKQLEDMRQALAAVDAAVAAGGNGVREDLRFHLAVAHATGNPYWVRLIEMLAPQIQASIAVTRANDSRRGIYQASAREDHERLLAAIAAGDPAAARAAARRHMEGAAERVARADPDFWAREGQAQARQIATSAEIY